MEDFRSLLVPKERPGSLYWNHHCDFRIGVAMCFEKRFGVEYEEASSENVLTSVAIETSRSFFRGRRQWPQASQSAHPARGPAWGPGAAPAFESLDSEKYDLE